MTGKPLDHAKALYVEGILQGNIDEALEAHVTERYTQHSTGVRSGKEGFKEFFEEFLERNPVRDITIIRTIEDGENCFIHAYQDINDGAYKYITMDMFDTDENGMITEHWDVIELFTPIEDMKSGNDMVNGPTDVQDEDKTAENKKLVKSFVKTVLCEKKFDRTSEFVSEDFVEHSNLGVSNGSAGMEEALNSGQLPYCEMMFKLIGQGNLVVTLCKKIKDGAEFAAFDLYRVADGLIAERWGASEPIGPKEEWVNPGKF